MARSQPTVEQQVNASRRAGRELAQAYGAGARPVAVQARIALGPGEFCAGQVPVVMLQWLEGDGGYVHKSGGWMLGGGVLGAAISVVSITSHAVGNSARRSRASQEAMAQWRPVDQGHLYVTNRRFCVQGSQWSDIWFQHIRMSDCDGRLLIFQLEGSAPTALSVPVADYWFVLFNKLAYDTVVMPPAPTDEAPALPAPGHPTGPYPTGPHPTGPHPTGPHPTGPHPTGGPGGDLRAIEPRHDAWPPR